ncbi:MAG: hypothetical protein IPM34_07285 [Saprospiraceae bacterium]|nr:hypothetical protein [Saprospiraceae bacterium]
MSNFKFSIYFISILLAPQLNSQKWNPLNGPDGALITAAIITKENANIYCVTLAGDILLSRDKGVSWENTNNGLVITRQEAFSSVLKESPDGIIYLRTLSRIYKLEPATQEWKIILNGIVVLDFDFSPDGKLIYAGNQRELYLSSNGQPFDLVNTWFADNIKFLCLGNDHNLVIRSLGLNDIIWAFNDDGSKLQMISDSRCCRSIFYHNKDSTLYDLSSEIRTTKDFGNNWQVVTSPEHLNFIKMFELQDSSLLLLSLFGSLEFYNSIDQSRSWKLVYSNHSNFIYDIEKNSIITKSNDDHILFLIDSDLYITNPSGNLTKIKFPFNQLDVKDFFQYNLNHMICKTLSSYLHSNDDGLSWNALNPPTNFSNFKILEDGTFTWISSTSIFFSNAYFQNIVEKPLPTLALSNTNFFIDNHNNIIYISDNQIYISSDRAATFTLLGENTIFDDFYVLYISPQNILYGSNGVDVIYYSTDYGISWHSFKVNETRGLDRNIKLTHNNIFYWYERDSNLVKKLWYSPDFGNTRKNLNTTNDEIISIIDEYDNVYTYKSSDPVILKITNTLSNLIREISLKDLNINADGFKLFRGENDYLYALVPFKPIFKYEEKLTSTNSLLSGRIMIDENANCKQDSLEDKTQRFQLLLKSAKYNITIPVNDSGSFSANLPSGLYNMELHSQSPIWKSCNFPSNFELKADSTRIYNELLAQPREFCADIYSSLVFSRLRRCNIQNLAYLEIRNAGVLSSFNTEVNIVFDDYFENIQVNISPVSNLGNLFKFIIPEIEPGHSITLIFRFEISCSAQLGQEHCIRHFIINQQKCNSFDPITDTLITCERNVGSFDPNDKMVYVNGKQTDKYFEADTSFAYLIRFQNTGSDTALNIRITDQLSTSLEWLSFNAITASHPNTFKIHENGMLDIQFNQIYLPDSNIDEQNSHGYFLYSIKPKKQVKLGTFVYNTAEIYFDFNEPISTNISRIKFDKSTHISEYKFRLTNKLISIPNPADQFLEILIPSQWNSENIQVTLHTTEGKLLRKWFSNEKYILVKREDLQSGSYILHLKNSLGDNAYTIMVFK